MPIRAACKCGKAFAAPDNLAGKVVKCPACGQALQVPGPAAAARPAPAPAPVLSGGLADLLDEAGITQHAGPRCPACGDAMPPTSLICVKCGFNRQTGVKAESSVATGPKQIGHGEAATALLQRAAEEMAKAPVDKDDKDTGGVKSVWTWIFVIFLPILFAIGFGAAIFWGGSLAGPFVAMWTAIQANHYLIILPGLILVLGILALAFGWLHVTSTALEKSVVHGLFCMLSAPLAGIYCYYWGMLNWRIARSPMQTYLTGLWILIFGYWTLVCCVAIEMGMYGVIAPVVIYAIGSFVAFLGAMNITIRASEEGIGHGLACLLTGIYTPIYGFMRWKENKKDMILFLIGFSITVVGIGIYVVCVLLMHVMSEPNIQKFFQDAADLPTGLIAPLDVPTSLGWFANSLFLGA